MLAFLLLLSTFGPPADNAALLELPTGAKLAIQLDHSVKSKTARPGDVVEATLIAPVVSHGVVLIPKSAKVRGHVLLARSRQRGARSNLAIQFHEARWEGGTAVLSAFIIRQLVARKSVQYLENAPTCPGSRVPPRMREPTPREGSPPQDPAPNPCDASLQIKPRNVASETVFSENPLKDMRLMWASDLNVTVLVSARKDVGLNRGTMLEIRHLAP